MATYYTPSGLSALAQTESSGNPTAQNSSSSASGLYGFLTGTWQTYAPQAGVDTSQYPTAASAPASVQTSVAQVTPITNWTCPGCNSAASGIAAVPGNTTNSVNFSAPSTVPDFFTTSTTPGSQSSTPIADGGSGVTDANGDSFSFAGDGTTPSTGTTGSATTLNPPSDWSTFGLPNPFATGAVTDPGTIAAQAGSVPTGTTGTTSDFWVRAGLILLGIIVLAIGAFWLAANSSKVKAVAGKVLP